MILNFLEDEVAEKSVTLVHLDFETGITRSGGFFDSPQNKEKLGFMGPGEVFANVRTQIQRINWDISQKRKNVILIPC